MIERVLVAGGGTGGHLFPGVAVVEELRRRIPGLEVRFVGTARGIEARLLPRLGERVDFIDVTPLKGRSFGGLLQSAGVLPKAASQSAKLLRSFRPDLVIGVGGYASGPVLAASAAMGIRTAVLEQNVFVGLTNRLLAPFVGRAYVSFEETVPKFPRDKVRLLGNPVRRAFVTAAQRAVTDPDGFEAKANRVFVVGGSQGAKALNEEVPALLAKAGLANSGFSVLHQVGEGMRPAVEARYAELGIAAEVVPFIEDMAAAYTSAAFVVGRAGATTVAEICALGRPSVLIPFPDAADDHQGKNAEALARAGAAVCVRQSALGESWVVDRLRELLSSAEARRNMSHAARGLGRPDAAAAIVDDLLGWFGVAESAGNEEAGTTPSDGAGKLRTRAKTSQRASSPYIPLGMAWSQRRRSSVPPHRRAISEHAEIAE